MIYITGDLHGDLSRVSYFSQSNNTKVDEDIMIVLGDAGFNYYGDEKDSIMKHRASKHPITYFCIHGNHEMRPTDFAGYKLKDFCGGLVYYQKKYPNILFAKDGEIYCFGSYDCIVIGGAYSVDKDYRLARGLQWFANEHPSDEIKQYVEQQLEKRNYQIDIVLSHTCPVKYEPVEVFLPFID